MTDLKQYMADSIRDIMGKALRGMLTNPREARFAMHMQSVFARSEKRRRETTAREGVDVPPFLIASIATTCNLHCKGCYARQAGIAADSPATAKATLDATQWRQLMDDAAAAGVCFCLVAGGEPLTRHDVLEQLAGVEDIIFPVFTNGTMIGATYTDFFRRHLNMVPVVSLEGDAGATDARRGNGVYRRAMEGLRMLREEKLFFGVSITVTTENMHAVTSPEYMEHLHGLGCRLVFLVEYVPTTPGTAHLALDESQSAELEHILAEREPLTKDMIVLSFPGDEKALGGCLAAGRGFFHIGPDGAAEPCPFSTYSDTNAARDGLMAALRSPLFRSIRDARALGWDHTGGCTLYEHRDEVEAMLRKQA